MHGLQHFAAAPRLAGLRACALAGPLFSLYINRVRVPCPTSDILGVL